MWTRSLALLLGSLALGGALLAASPGRAAATVRVGVRFVVAEVDGKPVASDGFLREQLAAAQQIYEPLGIELVRVKDGKLPAGHAELYTRADRDALAAYVTQGVIDCMVVAKLMDVDEPDRERRGVHWTPRSAPERHFVIVSAISFAHVFAHELGHFFGNPRHSDTPGNLMSYQGAEVPPFLDADQQRRVRATLARMLRRAELVAR